MSIFLAFLTAFGLTVVLVPLVARVARVRGLYAQPSFDRWHRRPVPNVGGIAMLLPLAFVVLAAGLFNPLGPVMAASTLMFALGLADDLHPMRPSTKLVLQLLVAAALLSVMPGLRITGQPALDLMLGCAWIVGITNAVNLIDNIDGLAAGVAGIAGAFFLFVLWLEPSGATTPIAAGMGAFVGVTAGFLLYNFHPASIFMGDGGSHLLGSFLAGATLVAMPSLGAHLAPVAAVPIVLLLIPIFDTAFVVLLRGLAGRSAFLGGRDHTSHRLVALGIGERRAVIVLYLLTTLGGAVAVGLVSLPQGLAWGLVGLYVGLLALVGVYLGHVPSVTQSHEAEHPLPSEIAVRYRLYEVVLDAALIGAAYYLAFVARFREPQFQQFLPYFTRSVPLVIGLQLASLWATGKYRQVWGSLGPYEILALSRGAVLGVAASVIAVLYIDRFEGYSRWVFAFDAILAPTLIVSARVALSGIDQYLRLRRSRGRTAFIYGAGRGGAIAMREVLQNTALELTPLGFIDDDPKKRRWRIDGLPVLGSLDDLAALLDRRPGRVAAVVVSISELPRERFDRVCEICLARGIAVRRMRVDLEDVRRPERPGVVRFPGA